MLNNIIQKVITISKLVTNEKKSQTSNKGATMDKVCISLLTSIATVLVYKTLNENQQQFPFIKY